MIVKFKEWVTGASKIAHLFEELDALQNELGQSRMNNVIKTNNIHADCVLKNIETRQGLWHTYGNDGRSTIETVQGLYQTEGQGFKARFLDNPNGGEYGWGPIAETEDRAIILLLAECLALA
jgi:hypothetical protein